MSELTLAKLDLSETEKRSRNGFEFERLIFGYSSLDFPEPRFNFFQKGLEEVRSRRHKEEGKQFRFSTGNIPAARVLLGSLYYGIQAQFPKRACGKMEFISALGTSFDRFHRIDMLIVHNKKTFFVDFSQRMKRTPKDIILIQECVLTNDAQREQLIKEIHRKIIS